MKNKALREWILAELAEQEAISENTSQTHIYYNARGWCEALIEVLMRLE